MSMIPGDESQTRLNIYATLFLWHEPPVFRFGECSPALAASKSAWPDGIGRCISQSMPPGGLFVAGRGPYQSIRADSSHAVCMADSAAYAILAFPAAVDARTNDGIIAARYDMIRWPSVSSAT